MSTLQNYLFNILNILHINEIWNFFNNPKENENCNEMLK